MKVVFLDFDGPIIPTRSFVLSPTQMLDQPCATSGSLVNEALKRTDAKLVISSTWRYDGLKVCQNVLRAAKVDIERLHADWETKHFYGQSREDEIHDWVTRHEIEEYIAIDDMPLEKLPNSHKVHVTTQDGFLLAHYEQACKKLGVEPYDRDSWTDLLAK